MAADKVAFRVPSPPALKAAAKLLADEDGNVDLDLSIRVANLITSAYGDGYADGYAAGVEAAAGVIDNQVKAIMNADDSAAAIYRARPYQNLAAAVRGLAARPADYSTTPTIP